MSLLATKLSVLRASPSHLLAVAAIGVGTAALFSLDLHRSILFDVLREHRIWLSGFVATNGALSAAAFILVFAISTAVSLPFGLILTVAGGFLFGSALGTALTVTGATLGACGAFLATRTAFGDMLRVRAGGAIARMVDGFREDAFSYLLVLRIVPLFPFFVVNLAPAFLGVSVRTFVLTTVIGIAPATFVYSSVGAGLGSVLDQGGAFPATGVTPEILAALIGLAVLPLVPVIYKRVNARRTS